MELIHNSANGLSSSAHSSSIVPSSPLDIANTHHLNSHSQGTALLETRANQAMPMKQRSSKMAMNSNASSVNEHNHAPNTKGNLDNHLHSLSSITATRGLDLTKLKVENSLIKNLGRTGDLYQPGGGKNTLIGTGDADIFVLNKGGLNTVTTGGGADTLILGAETTNRVFDFNPNRDKIAFDQSLDLKNIVIGQGTNPGKGGLDQPLDSVNNTLIIDKSTNHILASLAFTKSNSVANSEARNQFAQVNQTALDSLNKIKLNVHRGDGKQTGTAQGHDRFIGIKGNDFFFSGDSRVKLQTAKTFSGKQEFPFPNDSSGSSELTPTLQDGVLTLTGSYQNFVGLPLFSQGEKTIDPKATILNGSDPVSLINGFLKVPKDVEGNSISGTHLHFSPSEDSRGNFADATVVRYLTNTVTDAKSGKLSAQFHLTSDEQAAFLAGDLYVNIHSNVGGGFPTGENRINFNQNVVKLV
jgi:hypothetical protein